MSSRENFLRGSILRFLFFVWANSLGPIRDLANVARAKHAETDREEMRKRSWFLPGIEPAIFGNFNEPVSIGKQFKICSKRRAIGFLFDDK